MRRRTIEPRLEVLEDRAMPSTAALVGLDAATQGNWVGKYGSQGYNLPAVAARLPGYATLALDSDIRTDTWATGVTGDPRVLQDPAAPAGPRTSAAWEAALYDMKMTLSVSITDGRVHEVSLYLADIGGEGAGTRETRVDAVDPVTGAVLAGVTLGQFTGGQYARFDVSGAVDFRVSNYATNYITTAAVSGLFFDPAVRPPRPSAIFVGSDRTTAGAWQGHYGADGYAIAGGTRSVPAYAVADIADEEYRVPLVFANPSTDPGALQSSSAPGASSVLALWHSGGPDQFTEDVDVGAGTHEVSLYFVDRFWGPPSPRTEDVSLVAPDGTVLDRRVVSGFGGGEYLSWNVSGHVQFVFDNLQGDEAVLSGLFFDPAAANTSSQPAPAATATASFARADTTTQGNWQGAYGAGGYLLAQGPSSLPAWAQVTVPWVGSAYQGVHTWASPTTDPRALENPDGTRTAAAWAGLVTFTYADKTITADVNLTDGKTHQLAVYLLDWDAANFALLLGSAPDVPGRSEQVSVVDAGTGAVLDTRTATNFTTGEYLVYGVTGHVQLRFTNLVLNGSDAAVYSGIFLGGAGAPPPLPTPPAVDTTTQGSWQGHYGADGYVLPGVASAPPAYATVTPSNNLSWVWAQSTQDVRALQKPPPATDREAACWFNGVFTVDINITDGRAHKLSLYLVDYDSTSRVEQVDVLDAAGNVLDSGTASGFHGGEYLSWTVSGDVTVRFTSLGGANAVLSGLFFG
jgi:hypothetical protein